MGVFTGGRVDAAARTISYALPADLAGNLHKTPAELGAARWWLLLTEGSADAGVVGDDDDELPVRLADAVCWCTSVEPAPSPQHRAGFRDGDRANLAPSNLFWVMVVKQGKKRHRAV
jgi:hypothetical protein